MSHCQYEEAEERIFHPAHAGKYGNKAVTICSDDTAIFVMSLTFQYKISVLLIKQLGTKTMMDLLTLQSCGHYWYLGKPIFHIPYSHRMSHSIFSGHGKIIIFIFLTSNKEIMDDSHDLDQN